MQLIIQATIVSAAGKRLDANQQRHRGAIFHFDWINASCFKRFLSFRFA
jgi:hypothetical protein